MHIRTWKSFRLRGGSGHVPPAPAGLCTRAVCGSAQAGLSPAHIPWVPLMEILRGARPSGDLLICWGRCTWLFLSCERNSQRGKQLAQSGTAFWGGWWMYSSCLWEDRQGYPGIHGSWLKCNFTDMHEVTPELIHPSK